MMNKSLMFKKAHAMAKKVHVKGMNYSVTFSISLKITWEEFKNMAEKLEITIKEINEKAKQYGLTAILWEKHGKRVIYVNYKRNEHGRIDILPDGTLQINKTGNYTSDMRRIWESIPGNAKFVYELKEEPGYDIFAV